MNRTLPNPRSFRKAFWRASGIAVTVVAAVLAAWTAPPQQPSAAHADPTASTSTPAVSTLPPGDPANGKLLFEGKGACLTCHRVGGTGSRLGPDLTEIGAVRTPAELQQSLVDPAAEILPENRFFKVVTRDGTTVTGRLLNQDTYTVQLMDQKENLRSFDKSRLREYSFVKGSPMPAYAGKFSPQELADVIAYLGTLKGIAAQ
jgi:quinoprotein glucose dehydrogenase